MEDDVVDLIQALPGEYADDFLVDIEITLCAPPNPPCAVEPPADLEDSPRV